jgi:shikimate kinase
VSSHSIEPGQGLDPSDSHVRHSIEPGALDSETRHIALVGMMAVGKTTVGRILSVRLGRPFVDLDQAMVEQTGLTVLQMFAEHGEPWFRLREAEALQHALEASEPSVISLGGGAVTTERCRELLKAHAFVVWLRASPSTVLARIGDASTRPLLATDPENVIKTLDLARRDLYASVAHFAVSVDRRSPRWVSGSIARRVGRSSPLLTKAIPQLRKVRP